MAGVNRAKRTQFPVGRAAVRTNPIWWGSNVRNEPNSSGRPGPRRAKCAKRTQFPAGQEPHHSTIPSFQRSNPMAIVRNKPNWAPGQTGPWLEQIVRNKPNSPQASGRASALWKRSYAKSNLQMASEKQSQFTHGRQWAGAGRAAGAATGAGCTNKANSRPWGRGDGSATPAIVGRPHLLVGVNRMGIIGARANDSNAGSNWED
jgi:hypothetical protein